MHIAWDSIANIAFLSRYRKGKDKQHRKKRECSWCKLHNSSFSFECKGREGLAHGKRKNNSSYNENN